MRSSGWKARRASKAFSSFWTSFTRSRANDACRDSCTWRRRVDIRPATRADSAAWERMRQALWPSEPGKHAHEIARYFDLGGTPQLLEVLLAYGEKDEAEGMVELSIRPYAEGCVSDRVAFVEGWYVEPSERLKGIGAARTRPPEHWG